MVILCCCRKPRQLVRGIWMYTMESGTSITKKKSTPALSKVLNLSSTQKTLHSLHFNQVNMHWIQIPLEFTDHALNLNAIQVKVLWLLISTCLQFKIKSIIPNPPAFPLHQSQYRSQSSTTSVIYFNRNTPVNWRALYHLIPRGLTHYSHR